MERTINVSVKDIKTCLGETTRLINEIRLDKDLKYKIPVTADYIEITSKLYQALKCASMFSEQVFESDAEEKLKNDWFMVFGKGEGEE